MTYEEIIEKVAQESRIPKTTVDKIYRAYWRSIREYIVRLPLKKDLTDEEFEQLRPNVNIPSLGKLYVTLEKYRRTKKQFEYIKEKSNKVYDTHQEN